MFNLYHLRLLALTLIIGSLTACAGSSEDTEVPANIDTGLDQIDTTPVDETAPSKPSNLQATSVTASFVQLQWSASTDNVLVSGYRVYRNSILLGTVSQTAFLDTQVSENTAYEYSVVAFDSANNTNSSNYIAVNTPFETIADNSDTTNPTAPGNLRTSSSPTESTVSLTWNASTDNVAVSGYRIYRNNSLINTTTSTSYTDSSVSADSTYSYVVRAFDAADNSTASNTLSVNTPAPADTTDPTTPTGLVTTSNTSNSVSISWDASSDNVAVTRYYVYRDSNQIGNVTTRTFTDTTVQPGVNYEYRVAAADAAGNTSALSSVLAVTTPTGTPTTSFPEALIPISYDCSDSNIHCVDDNSSSYQEFSSIQAAVSIANAGDTIIVHDGTYSGFTVSTSGSSDSNRITITGNGNDVLINNGGSSQGRVLVSNSDYITIEGLTIEGASSYCLAARDASANNPMVGVIFQFNTVRNCGRANIYMSQASYSLILGNITYGSSTSHGIYLSNAGSDNSTIKGNRSYNNAVDGLHFNGDSNNGGDGLHSNIVIDGNILYDNGQSGVDADGLYDSLFINNLIYGNTRHGVRGFQIDSSAGVARLHFVNNTLVNNGSWGIKLSEDIGGHVFFNNIIMNNANGCIASGHSNLSSDSNIYSTSCNFSVNSESTVISYSTWTSNYSDSSIQTSLNTIVTNSSSDDYTLASGSAAIDSGLSSFASVLAPVTDIQGTARPSGSATDIGAFEKN